MKRILIILLLASLNSYAQEGSSNSSNFKRVQIGVNISPDICYRFLKNTNQSKMANFIKSHRDDTEIIKIGYTAGLNICFNLQSMIGIEAGIQYSNKGYQTKFQEQEWVTSNGVFDPSLDPALPNKFKYIYNDHYIDIPIKVNFTFGKKKVRLFTSAGIITNVFIKETQRNIYKSGGQTNENTQTSNINYNRFNISPMISVGIDYKFNERMNLRVEPTFRYGILKIVNAPVGGYLYNAGLNVSYYFGT